MKREEKIAKEYLDHQGFKKIKYEPDGNIPPDFLVNNKIAIEVRRLNKHYRGRPLEELEFDLIPKIRGLFKKYKDMNHNSTDFTIINYSRPLTPDKAFMNRLRQILDDQFSQLGLERELNIGKRFSIRFTPSSRKLRYPFEIGIMGDYDSGGFVVGDIYDSLKIIIKEKERKIQPYLDRYSRWWLVLIDNIGYGLNSLDLSQLKQNELEEHIFERIVFVPPLNPKGGLYIDYGGSPASNTGHTS